MDLELFEDIFPVQTLSLEQAWDSLLRLQVSKGFPKEFWNNVAILRPKRQIIQSDLQALVSLIHRYESAQSHAS